MAWQVHTPEFDGDDALAQGVADGRPADEMHRARERLAPGGIIGGVRGCVDAAMPMKEEAAHEDTIVIGHQQAGEAGL
jgi:hypothetical protein